MSEDNTLFQEIDESLRIDKLQHFWEQSGNLVIGGCVAVVLLTIASVLWKNHLHNVHSEQTNVLIQADKLIQSAQYDAARKLVESTEYNSSGVLVIAKLRSAEAVAKSGDLNKAFVIYSEIANDSHADIGLRDFAALQATIIADNLHTSFDGAKLSETGMPFAVSIDETKAAHLLQEGKNKEAAGLLKPITDNTNVPNTERARAMELLDATGEDK